INDQLLSSGLASYLLQRKARPATDEDILRVHDAAYLQQLKQQLPRQGYFNIDADTLMNPHTLEAAYAAAGAGLDAVDGVMGQKAAGAFCAVRPPGHHAERNRAMGFCLFNNAVIGARHAQRRHGLERVAIVDWDVHHGNGTQEIVWDDPSILYVSTHQMPLYPGTGEESETGAGNIVNVPLPPGTGGPEFEAAFGERVLPAVHAFRPDLIIISAGFDAHWRDPLAALNLREEDFAEATAALMAAAARHCGGRIVSLLEGGYDLEGLADSAAAHVATLMGA